MTEELLMSAVKQGDLQKAASLFDLYHRRLYGFFYKLTMDREQAHDLTQNVFYRLIKYRHTYKEHMLFKAWVFQLARNVHADQYRKKQLMKADFAKAENIQENGSLIEQIEQHDKEKLLHEALSRLSAEQRELLVLSRFEQLKYEEIAHIMHLTVANVKVKVHRAMIRLKEIYFHLEKH